MRKQVYDLTISDLSSAPVWEFALDEEGIEGQDEATVRPYEFDGPANPSDGMLVVSARFELADGSELVGYLTPPSDDDSGLGVLQPVIVTTSGQVAFWQGVVEPSRADLDRSYDRIGRVDPTQVFPIRFRSAIPLTCGVVLGAIDGFLLLDDWETGRTRVLR